MGKDTYETEARDKKLETYEWDDVWVDHADNDDARVLLIGDSISRGYRHFAVEAFLPEYRADNYATSKGADNPALIKMIDLVLSQSDKYEIVNINNGLHGWHLSTKEYKESLDAVIAFIKEKYPKLKLYIALSTPVRVKGDVSKLDERNALVIERNNAAREIAEKYDLPVNDLYTPLFDHPELFAEDGVHFKDDAYKILAKVIADAVKSGEK